MKLKLKLPLALLALREFVHEAAAAEANFATITRYETYYTTTRTTLADVVDVFETAPAGLISTGLGALEVNSSATSITSTLPQSSVGASTPPRLVSPPLKSASPTSTYFSALPSYLPSRATRIVSITSHSRSIASSSAKSSSISRIALTAPASFSSGYSRATSGPSVPRVTPSVVVSASISTQDPDSDPDEDQAMPPSQTIAPIPPRLSTSKLPNPPAIQTILPVKSSVRVIVPTVINAATQVTPPAPTPIKSASSKQLEVAVIVSTVFNVAARITRPAPTPMKSPSSEKVEVAVIISSVVNVATQVIPPIPTPITSASSKQLEVAVTAAVSHNPAIPFSPSHTASQSTENAVASQIPPQRPTLPDPQCLYDLSGTKELYRAYNSGKKEHMYTTDRSQLKNATANGYRSEGVVARIPPGIQSSAPPHNRLFATDLKPKEDDNFSIKSLENTIENILGSILGPPSPSSSGPPSPSRLPDLPGLPGLPIPLDLPISPIPSISPSLPISPIPPTGFNPPWCQIVPLFNLFHTSTKDHLFTTSMAEARYAVRRLGYTPKGVAGYVLPAHK